jgi:acyl carrier protein
MVSLRDKELEVLTAFLHVDLVEIISKELGIVATKITLAAQFVGDLGANPFDIVELILALEEVFEIKITDAEAERIHVVHDALDCIVKACLTKAWDFSLRPLTWAPS